MSRPSVSVVIPVFNVGHMISEAVLSVLAQTTAPEEIIVVDDGSTDDTASHLAPLMKRITYVRQDNRGAASARNRGIGMVSGDLVAFLDGDDVWHPSKLERQMSVWLENPGLGCLGTASYPYEDGPPDLDEHQIVAHEHILWTDLLVRNCLMTSTIMADRVVLREVGPFDESLQGPEDHDLWIRIAEVAPVARIPLPLTGYRTVPGSLSRQAMRMESGMRRILEKLDEREVWHASGSDRLRRKAYSYMNYSSSYMFADSGDPAAAVWRLMASIAWYPTPFAQGETSLSWARPRMLARYLLQLAFGPWHPLFHGREWD